MSEQQTGGGADPARTREQLEAAIAELEEQQSQAEAQARELMEREAAGEGPFAGEIFRLKQEKQRLGAELGHQRARLNYLNMTGELPPQ